MVEAKICKVHNVELSRMRVPIAFGLRPYDPALEVKERRFPNSNSYQLGGCVIDTEVPQYDYLLTCKKCREAERSWRELYEAYLETSYVVHDDGVDLTIRVHKKNIQLNDLLKQEGVSSWAFLTAYNPFSTPLTEPENLDRQAKLIQHLESRGLRYLRGFGKGDDPSWEPEPSLFILDIGRNDAIAIGRQFDQNAILWGEIEGFPELIWCD
ncbi:hypothetical protein BH10ACI2_BH10ACI2_17150 [soil metagenome]